MFGSTFGEWLGGEVILTQKGVVFLEAAGLFHTSRRRHHSYPFDQILGVRIESRGITGALSGEAFLAIDVSTAAGAKTYKYSCHRGDAERLCGRISGLIQRKQVSEELKKELLRLVKPKGEADLREIARFPSVRTLAARFWNRPPASLQDESVIALVVDLARLLISEGLMDGIIDASGKWASSIMLSRKSVQFHVTIDFTSLLAQLKNKGILVQSIECPSCHGMLDCPDSGSTFKCKYCNATVHAMDLFEKFKGLLGP